MNADLNTLIARLLQLEQDNVALKSQFQRERRRFRLQALLGLCALVGAILLSPGNRTAIAQGGSSLKERVAALESAVKALQTSDASQNSQIAALQTGLSQEIADRKQGDADTLSAAKSYTDNETSRAQAVETGLGNRIAALEDKTQYLSVSNGEMYLTGTNLHILNGLGSTDHINGLGNLILGYNSLRNDPFDPDNRAGSHNIIVGDLNNYASYGGVVVGQANSILAPYASVTGGKSNTASAVGAFVSGGGYNTASGAYSSVTGGALNTASGNAASVSGGRYNTANGSDASVSGGEMNRAGGDESSVSGGYFNIATHPWSSISGGNRVVQQNDYGWSGGDYHTP